MKNIIRLTAAWFAILFSFFASIGYVHAQIVPQAGFAGGGGSGGGSGTVTSISPANTSLTFTPNPITGTGTAGVTGAGSATANQSFGTNASNVFGFYPNAVNSGVAGQLVYYASTGAVVSGNALATISNGILSLGAAGSPGGLTLFGNTSGSTAISTPAVSGTNLITLPSGASTTSIIQSTSVGVWSYATALFNGITATTQTAGDTSTDVATDQFVATAISNAIAGVNPAQSVTAATTTAGNTSSLTYNNGVGGIGASFTGSVNTPIVFDGHTLVAGERDLIKNDTQSPSGAFNGVYQVTQIQTAILPPILTRALDYDQPSDINSTGVVPVITGAINGSTLWVQTANVITVGTTPLVFAQFSGGGGSPGGSTGQLQYNNSTFGGIANGNLGQSLQAASSTSSPPTFADYTGFPNITAVAPPVSSWIVANSNATTFNGIGTLSAIANTGGTTSAASDVDGAFVDLLSSATSGTQSYWNTNNGSLGHALPEVSPRWIYVIKTGASPTDIQNTRIWIGSCQISHETDFGGSANPAFTSVAFRYDTSVDGTVFWRTVASSGSGQTVHVTTTPVASNTKYTFTVDFSSPTTVNYYINGALVDTITTNLPSAASSFLNANFISQTPLTNAAVNIKFGREWYSSN